jgi:hypothetical protein
MVDIRNLFRVFALCNITAIVVCGGCVPAANPDSYPATPTVPTFTLAAPTATEDLSILWSPMPDINATVDYVLSSLPPPESNAVWTSTPGWLTPPSPTFTSSATPTATILFDTPKPGEVQGVRGTVSATPGPIEADQLLVPTASPQSGVPIRVLDPVTGRVVAQTKSGSYGIYEI